MSWRFRLLIIAPVLFFVIGTVMLSSCGGGGGCTGSFDAFGNFLPGVCPSPGPGLGLSLETIIMVAGTAVPSTPTPTLTKGQTLAPTPVATFAPTAGPTTGAGGGTVPFHAQGLFMKHSKTLVMDLTGNSTMWTSDNMPVLAPPQPGTDGVFQAIRAGCACAGVTSGGVSADPVSVTVIGPTTPSPTPCPSFCPTAAATATSTPKGQAALLSASSAPQAQSDRARINGVLQWVFNGVSPIESQLVASSDDHLYFITHDGSLHALDRKGHDRWTRSSSGKSVAVAPDGTVYSMGASGTLEALSPRGKPLWSIASTSTNGPLAASADVVYFQEGALLMAASSTGTIRWRVSVAGEISSAAIGDDGAVLAASAGGAVVAIAPDGSRRWTFSPNGGFQGQIAVRGNRVYLGSGSGRLYALDASSGAESWHYDTSVSVAGGPVVNAAGPIFFGSDAVYALTADGQLAWSRALEKGPAAPLASDGEGGVFAPLGDDIIGMLNSDGSTKWGTRSFGPVERAAVSASGVLYVASQGRVYAVK